jgi:hypothetical protein
MKEPIIATPQDEALRLETSTTRTATGSSGTLDLGAGFAPNGAGDALLLETNVPALTVAGNNSYNQKIQQSADQTTWFDASANPAIAAAGVAQVGAFVTMRYVKGVYTLGGTNTPSMTSEAYINKSYRM